MLVKPATIAGLEQSDAMVRRIFVAGCAERMAQMFTGLRGEQAWRSRDVDLFIVSLDSLWADGPADRYGQLLREVVRFDEFEPSEEGVSDTAEIYAGCSAVAMRYALSCAADDDLDFAIKCGHIALTAMGMMDRAVPSNSFFEEEHRFQARNDVVQGNGSFIGVFRQECQASARKRFEVLLSRL